MESSSTGSFESEFLESSDYNEVPLMNDIPTEYKKEENVHTLEGPETLTSEAVIEPESPSYDHHVELDAEEIDKLFGILFESDSTSVYQFAGHERERTTFKPIRRFAPYPVHQQLFIQQQQEQERRRQSLMSVPSSRIATATRDYRDTFRCQDAKIMYSDMFRKKVVETVFAFINKHTTLLTSNESDSCEKCVVCMYNCEPNQTLRRLRCNHKFHRKCIDEWLVKSYLCPVCRTDLTGTGIIYKGLAALYHMWKEEEDGAEHIAPLTCVGHMHQHSNEESSSSNDVQVVNGAINPNLMFIHNCTATRDTAVSSEVQNTSDA